jgi:hypothetical protein
MAKLSFSALPTRSLMYVIIFGGGILLFVLLGILPAQKETEALELQIENINGRIEEQKILTPVYENLLKRTEIKTPNGLDLAPKEKIKKGQTEEVAAAFQEMAFVSHLNLLDFRPDLDSVIGNTGFLKVNLVMSGEFINLHSFLMQMCKLPYLELIEQISIRSVRDTKEIRIQAWLAHE